MPPPLSAFTPHCLAKVVSCERWGPCVPSSSPTRRDGTSLAHRLAPARFETLLLKRAAGTARRTRENSRLVRRSRLRYRRLDVANALRIDQRAFPTALGEVAPAVLRLGNGHRVRLIKRISSTLARVQYGRQAHAVIQGSLPLFGATDSQGNTTALDLGLSSTPNGFEPHAPLVPVSIPDLAAGVLNFPDLNMSVQFAGLDSAGISGQQDAATRCSIPTWVGRRPIPTRSFDPQPRGRRSPG